MEQLRNEKYLDEKTPVIFYKNDKYFFKFIFFICKILVRGSHKRIRGTKRNNEGVRKRHG